jgi:hypothetical protein
MGIEFDTHEVTALADAITKASAPALADTEAVVFKGALNIKKDGARRISGHPRLRRLPASIDFDMYRSLKGPAAEIGPNHSKPQGPLGNIAEFGTIKNAAMPFMRPAADAEQPRFEKAMEDLAVKALGLG